MSVLQQNIWIQSTNQTKENISEGSALFPWLLIHLIWTSVAVLIISDDPFKPQYQLPALNSMNLLRLSLWGRHYRWRGREGWRDSGTGNHILFFPRWPWICIGEWNPILDTLILDDKVIDNESREEGYKGSLKCPSWPKSRWLCLLDRVESNRHAKNVTWRNQINSVAKR